MTTLRTLVEAWLAGDPVVFQEPEWLWLLLLGPLLVLLLPRRRDGWARSRNLASLLVRLVALSALIVAAALPELLTQVPAVSLIVAVDQSASMVPERLDAMKERAEALVEAAGPDVPVHWVNLAEPEGFETGDDDEGTDLAGLVSLASRAGTHVPRRVLLLTDGAHNRGDALAGAVVSAAGTGVQLYPLAPERTPINAGVLDVQVPQDVLEGEPVALGVTVHTSRPGPVTVEARRGSHLLATHQLDARQDTHEVELDFDAPPAGTHRIEVQVRTDGDLWKEDDNRGAWLITRRDGPVWIRGPAAAAHPVQEALKAQGRRVRWSEDWSETPPPGSTLFVVDPDLRSWPEGRAAALRERVRDAGIDLVLAGDGDGMAEDADALEPLNRSLPVKFTRRREPRPAPLSIVYVIDTSGSMERNNKLDLAVTAVSDSVAKLHPRTLVGVLTFSDHYDWVVRFTKAEQQETILEALRRMRSSGGTTMYPALAEAGRRLATEDSALKHVLLLTDGRSLTRLQQNNHVIRRLSGQDITVSTVAISPDSAREELAQVAELTGGRSWYTETWDDLPRILVEETVMVVGKDTVDSPDRVWPVPESPLAGTVDWSMAPPLGGHNAARARPTADLGLLLGEGGDPVLSSWRYGAGSVTTFASEPGSGWGTAWLSWSGFGPWLDELVDAVRRRPPQEQASIRLEPDAEGVGIRLTANDVLGNPRTRLSLSARVRSDQGERTVPLAEEARGQYRGHVTWDGPLLVQAAVPGTTSLPPQTLRAQASAPVPLELLGALEDREALALLARATGGVVEPSVDELFADLRTRDQARPLWPWLMWLALWATGVELAIRRLRLPRYHGGRR